MPTNEKLPRVKHDHVIAAARAYVKKYRTAAWEDDKYISLHFAQFARFYIRILRRQARGQR